MSETEFISQLKKGDENAFRQLVAEYQEKVLNTCYGFVNNRQEAEDLTQDVFVEIFRGITNFKANAKLSTWIYRIAVSKSLEEIRNRKRQKRAAYFKSLIGLDIAKEVVASTDKSPHDNMEETQRIEIMQAAIAKLPENQRIAFTLQKFEQMPYQEIAEVMGTTVSAVESLLHRAKNNLKKRLYHYYQKKMI